MIGAALTARQLEVLRLVTEGLTLKETSVRLGIAVHTVNVHMDAIRDKSGQRRTALLVRWAIREGLVTA